MSEQSLELLERIRRRLRTASRRMTFADLLFGLVLTAGICSGVWAVSVAVEAGFWLDTAPRTFLFWSILVLASALFAYFLLFPLLRLSGALPGPSYDYVADRVGHRFPQVGDRLVNLLDLSEGRRSESPAELVDGAVQMLGRQVDPVPFEDVEDFSRPKRAVRIASVPLLALLVFLISAPSTFVDASKRILSPGVRFEQPAPFRLLVEPGTVDLARGSAMEISILAEGRALPSVLSLELNNVDEEHVEVVRLTPDSTGTFRHQLANVRKTFRYRVTSGAVGSPWFRASVTEHPMVRSLQVTLDSPGYSGIPPQRLDPNVGDISGLPGTSVHLEAALGGADATSASIRFDDDSTQPLEIDGGLAEGGFTLSRKGSYQIILENDRGVRNRSPISYSMNLVFDAAPSVVIVRPESDAVLNEDLRKLLETRISDDYGFRDLTLFYRLAESRYGNAFEEYRAIDLPLDEPRQLDQEVRFDWMIPDATDLDPVPGDVIEYYVRVRDNDSYAGFKAAETPVQRLRLPSLAEQYEKLNQEQDQVESQMENMMDQADQLDDQFRELRDELRRKQNADWEDQRQLEQIQQQQERLEQQVDDLSQQVESMNDASRQNNLLSPETLEMYQQMQKVVEEINSPELMDALRQLQQAVEELNLSQMQEAIENFEFNEEQYRQRLERALDLFKNLRAQQALEEAARRTEELAKQQERLAEKTSELMNRDEEGEDESEARARSEESASESDAERESRREEQDRQPPESGEGGESDEQKAGEQESAENEGERQSGENQEQSAESRGQQSEEQRDPRSEENAGEEPRQGEQQASDEQQDSGTPPSSEQLAREQELSQEEMQQLEELLKEAQKQVEEMKNGPAENMRKLNESVQEQAIPEQMQQNAEELRQNQLQNAKSGQQSMQQQLEQMQQQLSQMQSSMQGSQMQVNMAGLRRALGDILTLSKQQESLRDGLRNNVSEAPSMREDARRQVELSEGLSTVIDSVQQLSKNIPQMSREVQRQAGEALREMGQATESMTERSVAQASGHQKASMMHLNELALLLSEVMNQLMNMSGSGSGSGASMQQMIQQMQQMSQQQQQLNKQIQEFLNEAQGNRLSVDMQQRLQQMGAQQRAIKQQLDQLRRNPEARGKLLGDLEKIAEQMEETVGELERRQVDQRMVERQRQILQRLLDAQKSINQRGEEEERQGQEGQDVVRESPGELPPEEAADKLRRDLIRALESGYTPDYEELIKRYFELLQQQNSEQE